MGDAPPGPAAPGLSENDGNRPGARLDSWKEIASYLNRDLRTVQRWEKHGNLPVRRLNRPGLRAVFAYTGELDAWLQAQQQIPESAPADEDADSVPDDQGPPTTRPSPSDVGPPASRLLRSAIAVLAVAIAGVLSWSALRRDTVPEFHQFRVRPITSDPSYDRDPAISPDGKYLAYTAVGPDRSARVYVRLLDGGEPRPLTSAPDDERSPAWSPDGTRIAFLRGQPQASMTLVLTTPLGGQERPIAEVRPFAQRRTLSIGHLTAWTPDGRYVVASHQATHGMGQLWLFDVATGERRALTTPEADHFDVEPSFSSDGRLLLFGRVRGEFASDIFVQSLDADYRPVGPARKLPSVAMWNGTPRLLEDRDEVLLSAGSVPRLSLWRRRLDGTGEAVQVGSTSEYHVQADLHRLTGRIVSHVMRDQADVLQWELPSAPTSSAIAAPTRPLISSSYIDRSAIFSPDGSRIAFVSDRSGSRQLWVADANGANAVEWTQTFELDGSPPAWSPDGAQIAFSGVTAAGNAQLFIASDRTGSAKQVTSDALSWVRPVWSPDGASLYSAASGQSRFSLYRVSVGNGSVELVQPGIVNAVGVDPSGKGVYAVRRSEGRTLFELVYVPNPSGEPLPLAGLNFSDDAWVTTEGVYFAERQGRTNLEPVLLKFRTHAGRVRSIQEYSASPGRGLAVSPDGRVALTTRFGSWLDDLVLFEPIK